MNKEFYIDGDRVDLEQFNSKIRSFDFKGAEYTPRKNGGEVYSFKSGVTVDLTISTERNENNHERTVRVWTFTTNKK